MNIEMWPPHGGRSILAHPSQVENLRAQGWSETKRSNQKREPGARATPPKGKAKDAPARQKEDSP